MRPPDFSLAQTHVRGVLAQYRLHPAASCCEFEARVARGERLEGVPDGSDQSALCELLLPKVISEVRGASLPRQSSQG